MKKLFFGFMLCFVVFSVSVCKQKGIDKSLYTAIDPFDYRLEEKNTERDAVRKYKSVVRFIDRKGAGFSFRSLDDGTTLDLTVAKRTTPPAEDQVVTIYYTATKGLLDILALDQIDYTNTTEEGINLVKSAVSDTSDIDRASYREIDPFDYKIEAELAQQGDVRKYKSTVLFSSQNGIRYYFKSDAEELLTMNVEQRFPSLDPEQRVTVYFTATKGIVDTLSLDDIEL